MGKSNHFFRAAFPAARLASSTVFLLIGACSAASEDVAESSAALCMLSPLQVTRTASSATLTATTTCGSGEAPQYSFEYLRDGVGPWTTIGGWSSQNRATWNFTGFASGRYVLRVHVRRGTGAVDSTVSQDFHIGSTCTQLSVNPSPPSPQPPNGSVFVWSSATCASGAEPRFQYLVRAPGETDHSAITGWVAGSTLVWHTTGRPVGQYSLMVRVRAAGNPSTYEAQAVVPYVLKERCTSATLAVTPPSPQYKGAVLTLDATATCSNSLPAEFQFFHQPVAGGTRTVIRPWGNAASATWNTSAVEPGNYKIGVSTRVSGSSGGAEASQTVDYTVANPDRDGDGRSNETDNCPDVPNPDQIDTDILIDLVGDGRGDACDNCPYFLNADQSDRDGDRIGDVCDSCPLNADSFQFDRDRDGVGDPCDNCPGAHNPGQENSSGDLRGDACEGLPVLSIEVPGSSIYHRSDLTEPTTMTFSQNPLDLPINTLASTGKVTYSPKRFDGEEIVVYNFPYGLGPNDLGGANLLGQFTASNAWPYVPGLKYSRLKVPAGQTRSMQYGHNTAHVVRYVHGSCYNRTPLSTMFRDIRVGIEDSFHCSSKGNASRRYMIMQPHYRGQVGASYERPEMGFYFEADYRVSMPLIGCNLTIGMNPGYAIRPSANGLVELELINDRPNVRVVNDFADCRGFTATSKVSRSLREDFPAKVAEKITSKLRKPLDALTAHGVQLPPILCPDGTANQCFDQARLFMTALCAEPSNPALQRLGCLGTAALELKNFECIGNNVCAFHPIVQQVNVTPTDFEVVLAPAVGGSSPPRPLNEFYRALEAATGEDICTDSAEQPSTLNGAVTWLSENEGGLSSPQESCPPAQYECSPLQICFH